LKALYYNFRGKLKYDFGALLISFLGLVIGFVLGLLVSPWLFILCFLGPILAASYQLGNLLKLEDVEIIVCDEYIKIHYQGLNEIVIDSYLLKTVEIKYKKNFGSQFSISLILHTFKSRYEFILLGPSSKSTLLVFLDELAIKTNYKLIDQDQILIGKS
jgi:hypothetical protein